jgi:hypothetical protein
MPLATRLSELLLGLPLTLYVFGNSAWIILNETFASALWLAYVPDPQCGRPEALSWRLKPFVESMFSYGDMGTDVPP